VADAASLTAASLFLPATCSGAPAEEAVDAAFTDVVFSGTGFAEDVFVAAGFEAAVFVDVVTFGAVLFATVFFVGATATLVESVTVFVTTFLATADFAGPVPLETAFAAAFFAVAALTGTDLVFTVFAAAFGGAAAALACATLVGGVPATFFAARVLDVAVEVLGRGGMVLGISSSDKAARG
jgi:hypothetical protein